MHTMTWYKISVHGNPHNILNAVVLHFLQCTLATNKTDCRFEASLMSTTNVTHTITYLFVDGLGAFGFRLVHAEKSNIQHKERTILHATNMRQLCVASRNKCKHTQARVSLYAILSWLGSARTYYMCGTKFEKREGGGGGFCGCHRKPTRMYNMPMKLERVWHAGDSPSGLLFWG